MISGTSEPDQFMKAHFFFYANYYDIANEHLLRFRNAQNSLKEYEGMSEEKYFSHLEKIKSLEWERWKCAVICINFAAMCLESFIYDYAIQHMAKPFVDDHLDRSEFLSKWLLVIKLVTTQDFPKSDKAWEKLRILKSTRDRLIHHESKIILNDCDATVAELRKMEELFSNVQICFDTVKDVLVTLKKLDPNVDDKWLRAE